MSCPSPFVPLADYPAIGGDIDARVCMPLKMIPGAPTCCLPCPRQHWVYPDNFMPLISASTYFNLVGVACCVFVLLSYACLSVEYTNRHYLSVCLVAAILIMQTSFVIPMGTKNNQCFDLITPHDMYSNASCALSGAFLLGGAWCVAMWIFLRSVSLNLQICWQVSTGRRFFLASQAIGWIVPIACLAVVLSITGVSFRFGDSCHVNSHESLKTFWGPLLGVTGASLVLQIITFAYCSKVYIKSLLDDNKDNTTLDTPLPYATSVRTITPRQALRRIQRVIALQWRGIMVVIIIITDVIFFATVFLTFEGTNEKTPENMLKSLDWLECMLKGGGDKHKCLHIAEKMVVPEITAVAVIFLLSANGIWAMILIGRASMFVGWWHLIKDCFASKKPSDEFVSYNARVGTGLDPGYEMLGSQKKEIRVDVTIKTVETQETPKRGPSRSNTLKSGTPYSGNTNVSPSTIQSTNSNIQPSSMRFTPYLQNDDEDDYGYVPQGLTPKPPRPSHAR